MPQVTNRIGILKDHKERSTGVVFSPVDDDCLATVSADRTAELWKTNAHPSGKHLGTTSFDKTWRLRDINTGAELLLFLQEGHSRSVYGITFQQDGALAASSGLESLALVLSVNFSPNGYHLASRGEDNQCRKLDLRMRNSLYIIPTHSNLRFFYHTNLYNTDAPSERVT